MSDPVISVANTVLCPHGGTAHALGSSHRVRASGAELVALSDPVVVYGCDAIMANASTPCTTIRWQSAATRVRILGLAPLLETSTGFAVRGDGTMAGPANITVGQQTVKMI